LSVSQYYINFIATNCKRRNSLIVLFFFDIHSYNASERRESSKGGKDTNRRASVPSHTPAKSASTGHKAQASHGAKRASGQTSSAPQRSAKPSPAPANSGGPAYDEQVSLISQSV